MKGLENRLAKGVTRTAAAGVLAGVLAGCSVSGPKYTHEPIDDYRPVAKETTMDVGRVYRGLRDAEEDGKLTYDTSGCDQAILRGYLVGQSAQEALLQFGFDALAACGIKEIVGKDGNKALCIVGAASSQGGSLIGGASSSGSTSGRVLDSCNN